MWRVRRDRPGAPLALVAFVRSRGDDDLAGCLGAVAVAGVSCPHGEHESYCVECLEGPPPERPAPSWQSVGEPFLARFDGSCPACGRPVVAAMTQIQRWDKTVGVVEDRTVYTCAGCRP